MGSLEINKSIHSFTADITIAQTGIFLWEQHWKNIDNFVKFLLIISKPYSMSRYNLVRNDDKKIVISLLRHQEPIT